MTLARIRVIAATTIISLAALLALQGYWLWRGYREARAAFERQVDVALSGIRERIDPGDEISEQIAALTQRRDADASAARAVFAALRGRIDVDLARTDLPRRYTIVLASSAAPTMYWTDPASRDTAGARTIQLKPVCASCEVRLGMRFDDVGPVTFLGAIGGFVALSAVLVSVLIACVAATFMGLARLRRQNEQQLAFVNNLAHELRTPLFSISVAGKVLGHSDVVRDDDELSRQVALIGRAKDRLSRHAERLLDLAALQSGKTQVTHAVIDLNDLVRRAAYDVDALRESVGARLALKLTEAPVIVHGDAEHLEQAVTNLLDNAFKYGGSPATVVVRTKRVADKCLIEVEDAGSGVAQQHKADVFAPFFRVTNGVRSDVKGFGLGLSQVRAVVELHGGSVELRDAQPNGALFVVTLPAGPTS